ncbi:hypothetical protein [Rhizobium leguminosarum]|uniref:hypothetical protein n=1 Tax=Rhizobium leguminosarum TaxID=384 RepID=UPI002E15DE8F|nr:hypothetical protein U8Q02_38525 [Rhizobium leguminosarum]
MKDLKALLYPTLSALFVLIITSIFPLQPAGPTSYVTAERTTVELPAYLVSDSTCKLTGASCQMVGAPTASPGSMTFDKILVRNDGETVAKDIKLAVRTSDIVYIGTDRGPEKALPINGEVTFSLVPNGDLPIYVGATALQKTFREFTLLSGDRKVEFDQGNAYQNLSYLQKFAVDHSTLTFSAYIIGGGLTILIVLAGLRVSYINSNLPRAARKTSDDDISFNVALLSYLAIHDKPRGDKIFYNAKYILKRNGIERLDTADSEPVQV